MESLDFEYRIYVSLIALIGGLYCMWRHPTANVFMAVTIGFPGGAQLAPGVSYARAATLILALTCLRMMMRGDFGRLIGRAMQALRVAPPKALLILIGILWLKIGVDTAIYGMDASRSHSLLGALLGTVFSSAILALGLLTTSPQRAVRDFFLGMLFFPAAITLPLLPGLMAEGRIGSALVGDDRLQLLGFDTITTSALFLYGAMAALGLIMLQRRPNRVLTLGGGASFFGFLFLILLTGTRQHLAAVILFGLLSLATLLRGWARMTGVLAMISLTTVYIMIKIFSGQQAAVIERVRLDQVIDELVYQRGGIWQDALATVMNNPFLGVGFRNFGEEETKVDRTTGLVFGLRDSAHGLVQDVFVEHGIILGFFFLLLFANFLFATLKRAVTSEANHVKVLYVALLAIMPALLVSPTFTTSPPFFLLLVANVFLLGEKGAAARVDEAASLPIKRMPAGFDRGIQTQA